MKKIFWCLFLLAGYAAPALFAQVPVKVITQVSKEAVSATGKDVALTVLPPISGGLIYDPFIRPITTGAVSDLPNTSAVTATTPLVTKARQQRSLVEQIQRNIKAVQLKQLHAEQIELFRAKEKLPKAVEEESFFTENLYDISPDAAIRAESIELPVMIEPGMLYRGLALEREGKSIANILDNGLRVQDAGSESSTLITAYASHSQVASHVVRTADTKVTNLTNSPKSAVYWLYKRLSTELQIPVLVQVSGRTETGSLVVENKDIPPTQLTVFAKLKINNQARWCRVERAYNKDGILGFKITPFERIPVEK